MYRRLYLLAFLIFNPFVNVSEQTYALERVDAKISVRVGLEDDKESGEKLKYERVPDLTAFNSTLCSDFLDHQSAGNNFLFIENRPGNTPQVLEKPPLTVGKFVGGFISGIVAGGLLGGVTGLSGYLLFKENGQDDISGATGFIVGGVAGYAIGNTLGVYWFGTRGNQTGSYKVTLVSNIIGLAIGGLGLYLNERVFADPNWGGNDKLSAAIFLATPPLFTTIGFNLTRRYKSASAFSKSFLSLRDGHLNLAVPTISIRPNPFNKSDLVQNIDLIVVRF